jgi:MYXO-CTERM domain-containing protein
MKKLLLALFLLTSLVACGLADSPRNEERTGTAKSAFTLIDTRPDNAVAVFEFPTQATVGQVVKVPTNDPRPLTLDLRINGSALQTFRGELYAWDGTKATGPNLYESGPRTTGGVAMETVTFDLSALPVLVPDGLYVFFVTLAKDPNPPVVPGTIGTRSDEPYADGTQVHGSANPADWTTVAWTPVASDLAMAFAFDHAPTTTALQSSGSPTVFGQPVTLTATVSGAPGTPAGTVTFFDGAASLGTANLNAAGVATLGITSLGVGAHSLTASYAQNGPHAASTSGAVAHTVNKAATTTALASSADPSVVGASVTFTATVTVTAPGAGAPTGTVTFKDGAATLGTGTLNGAGVATFATSALTVGAHPITAEYGGDASFAGSTSSTVTQDVASSAATIALEAAPSPSVFGTSVTLLVTVSGTVGTPTGNVTFKEGPVVLGTGPLNVNGIASVATAGLGGGAHTFTVEYGGDASYGSATATASHLVTKAPTTTTLVASANPTVTGANVRLTASVASIPPGLGGSVTFFDGTTSLGTVTLSGGTASVTTTFAFRGVHPISASYAGDENFQASNSAAIALAVETGPADAGADAAGAGPGPGALPGSPGGGGCDCHVARGTAPAPGLGAVAVGILALLLRRRRLSTRNRFHGDAEGTPHVRSS